MPVRSPLPPSARSTPSALARRRLVALLIALAAPGCPRDDAPQDAAAATSVAATANDAKGTDATRAGAKGTGAASEEPVATAATAAGQAGDVDGRTLVTLAGETMGTTYSVKLLVPPEQANAARALQRAIDRALERVNDQMSTWRPDSELSRFNASRDTTPFAVSAATATVVRRALSVGQATDGAFDVTLAPLIRLWGFDRGGKPGERPSSDAIAAARNRLGLDKLFVVDDRHLRKAEPALEVNLSGIAKGYGVDVVADVVEAASIEHYLVEIGGEVRARGTNPRGAPWTLGVNVPKPNAPTTAVALAVPVVDRALATSGDYRNFFEADGQRYSHILDPRTGSPVTHDLVSVTVLAPDCTLADAYATALLVLGEAEGRAIVDGIPELEALFLRLNRTTGALTASASRRFPADPAAVTAAP